MEFEQIFEFDTDLSSGLVPNGIYDFKVLNAESKKSKTNKPMLVLTLEVYYKMGKSLIVKDYIVKEMKFKIKNLFDSVGKPELFTGAIKCYEFKDLEGKVEIKSERYKDSISYKVDNYITPRHEMELPSSINGEEVFEDEIPF